MALEVEGVVDGGVHAEKTLGGASRQHNRRAKDVQTPTAVPPKQEVYHGRLR